MDNVTGVLIVGGLGTRLRPALSDRPKALGEVGGRPFVTYLLDQLYDTGISKVVLCTGYKGQMLEDFLGDRYRSLDLIYSREPRPLGTGGAIRYAQDYFKSPTILVMNGDSFIDVSMSDVLDYHDSQNTALTMVVSQIDDVSRFGVVEVTEDKVVAFKEKNQQAGEGLINAGIYVLDKTLLSLIPESMVYSLEKEFFPALAEEREISAFKTNADFIDIGTPESFTLAGDFFRKKPAFSNQEEAK